MTLFPFMLAMAALQFATWAPIARRIRARQPTGGADVEIGLTG